MKRRITGPHLIVLGTVVSISSVVVVSTLAYLKCLPAVVHAFPAEDKVLHFLFFGTVAFFLHLLLRQRGVRIGGRSVPLAGLVVLAAAVLDEATQCLSTARSADLVDLASDAAGVLVFLWLAGRVAARARGSAS